MPWWALQRRLRRSCRPAPPPPCSSPSLWRGGGDHWGCQPHNYICMYISTNFNFLTLIRGAGNLSKYSCRSHQPSHLVQHSLLLKVEVEVFSTHRKTHERDDDQALHLDFNLVPHFFRLGSHRRCWSSSVFSILFIVFLAKALYLSNEICIIFAKVQTIF